MEKKFPYNITISLMGKEFPLIEETPLPDWAKYSACPKTILRNHEVFGACVDTHAEGIPFTPPPNEE